MIPHSYLLNATASSIVGWLTNCVPEDPALLALKINTDHKVLLYYRDVLLQQILFTSVLLSWSSHTRICCPLQPQPCPGDHQKRRSHWVHGWTTAQTQEPHGQSTHAVYHSYFWVIELHTKLHSRNTFYGFMLSYFRIHDFSHLMCIRQIVGSNWRYVATCSVITCHSNQAPVGVPYNSPPRDTGAHTWRSSAHCFPDTIYSPTHASTFQFLRVRLYC